MKKLSVWKRILIALSWAISFAAAYFLGKAKKKVKDNPIVGHREVLTAEENKKEYKEAIAVIADDIATARVDEIKRKFMEEFNGRR